MRFLIDECLSPALVGEAQAHGSEAYHLAHIGRGGLQDREIVAYAVARDLVLVTNNASDFRRLYTRCDLHPGLVIIAPNVERETQMFLFRTALSRLDTMRDLVNRGMEIDLADNRVTILEYELPRRT